MKAGSARKSRGDAAKLKVGIAVARFNEAITEQLLEAAREELRAWHVADKNISVVRVAGSFELPFACQHLLSKKGADAAIALGCVVKGETNHDEYIAQAVFGALQDLMRGTKKPIGLGILTVRSLTEAKQRIAYGNAAVAAALEAALL